MDSNQDDLRNLAHSAHGRNTDNSHEITKLKEEHRKEIQKLAYESKIELMESRMKIVNLTHELEVMKLKNSHEIETKQVQADRLLQKEKDDLQNKLAKKDVEFKLQLAAKDQTLRDEMLKQQNESHEKLAQMEKQLAAKENEITLYKKEQEKVIAAKENEWKLKMKDLENEHKIKILQMEKAYEMKLIKETKSRNPADRIPTKISTSAAGVDNLNPDQFTKIPAKTLTIIDRLVWGAEYFHEENESFAMYPSYPEWYKSISGMMENRKVYMTNKYIFVRKEFDYFGGLSILSKRKGSQAKEELSDFMLEGFLSRETWQKEKVSFFLLHPNKFAKRLKFYKLIADQDKDFECWDAGGVSKDFYFGTSRSAIVFGILL
eukprot:TCONS_00067706-protein